MGPDYIHIRTISLTAPHISISFLATKFTPFTGSSKTFEAVKYKSLQITTENLECLIIKMQNFIVLFTLLTFYSVVVFAGFKEVLNVAKCIAEILQELPNSCVSIMKSEEEERGKKNLNFFPTEMMCLKIVCFGLVSLISESVLGNTFLERKGNG